MSELAEQNLIQFFDFASQQKNSSRYLMRNSLLYFYNKNPQAAAVLVGFHRNAGEYEIILTERSSQLKNHSGQISFPGGKKDIQDENLIITAIRETKEEIGIAPNQIRTFGCLKKIRTPSNFIIQPTLAIIDEQPLIFKISSDEVDNIFSVPAKILLDQSLYQFKTVKIAYIPIETVFIDYQDKHIWGVTAEILYFLATAHSQYQNRKS